MLDKKYPPINLSDYTHISPSGNYMFAEATDGDFCTCIVCKDENGTKYLLDFSREEIKYLMRGFAEADSIHSFKKGKGADI